MLRGMSKRVASKGTGGVDVVWVGLGVLLVAAGSALTERHGLGLGLRLAGLAAFAIWAGRKGSLTPWIFFAMLAGAELGFDAPKQAVEMKVFSDIFLRLIKTIVAPLIVAMLVGGIAGHGDLKSVGRMGVKAIVYFEVVTTLALVIGLVAINVTKAGVGLVTSGPAAVVGTAALPPRWDEVLLHMFPENLAKSVAEGTDPAGGGICDLLWDCADDGECGETGAAAEVLREPGRGDVPVHEPGDVLCAAGSGGGDGVLGGQHRRACAGEPGHDGADAVRRAAGVLVRSYCCRRRCCSRCRWCGF